MFFIVFITSSVTLFLSNLFTTKITIAVIANVITYANILTFHCPSNNLSPAIVDDIIDGNLNNVESAKNLDVFIGYSPPI